MTKDKQVEICLTGFDDCTKSNLRAVAESHSIKVRTTVTKRLDCLIFGPNGGEMKKKRAIEQGVTIVWCGSNPELDMLDACKNFDLNFGGRPSNFF